MLQHNPNDRTVTFKHTEDFEQFRKSLDDRNIIRGYDITVDCNTLSITGSARVFFENCTIHVVPRLTIPVDIAPVTAMEIFTDAPVCFKDCSINAHSLALYLKTRTENGKGELAITGSTYWNLSIHCTRGSWEVTVCNSDPDRLDTSHPDRMSDTYLSVYNAAILYVQAHMPQELYTENTASIVLQCSYDTHKPRINIHGAKSISAAQLVAPGTRLCVFNSMLSVLQMAKSNIGAIILVKCLIHLLDISDTIIYLMDVHSSVCHKYTGKVLPPVTTVNSTGFPDTSTLLLYKTVDIFTIFGSRQTVIMELEVPPNSMGHVSSHSSKVRVSRARPVRLYSRTTCEPIRKPLFSLIKSRYNDSYAYHMGRMAYPEDPFYLGDADCASGIHGYLTLAEACQFGI